MSTKIYVAARVPQLRFSESLKLMHRFLLEQTYEIYEETMNSSEVAELIEKRTKGLTVPDTDLRSDSHVYYLKVSKRLLQGVSNGSCGMRIKCLVP